MNSILALKALRGNRARFVRYCAEYATNFLATLLTAQECGESSIEATPDQHNHCCRRRCCGVVHSFFFFLLVFAGVFRCSLQGMTFMIVVMQNQSKYISVRVCYSLD